MSKTWKAVLGVILIFIFGWVSGAISASLIIRHKTLAVMRGGPAAAVQAFERRMTRNLDLDANQTQQVDEAFLKNLNQRLELQKTIQPQIRALNQETLAKLNTVLKPEQKTTFLENIAEFRQRFGKTPFNPGGQDQPASAAPNATVDQPPAQ